MSGVELDLTFARDASFRRGEALRGRVQVLGARRYQVREVTLTYRWQVRGTGVAVGKDREIDLPLGDAERSGKELLFRFELGEPDGPEAYLGEPPNPGWFARPRVRISFTDGTHAVKKGHVVLLPEARAPGEKEWGYRSAPHEAEMEEDLPEQKPLPLARTGTSALARREREAVWKRRAGIGGLVALPIVGPWLLDALQPDLGRAARPVLIFVAAAIAALVEVRRRRRG